MNYSHIVYVKILNGTPQLCVDRLFEDGTRDFAMQFDIPSGFESEDSMWDGFETLAATLGKAVCIDCPDLRGIIGID